jgi:hypothetical protein
MCRRDRVVAWRFVRLVLSLLIGCACSSAPKPEQPPESPKAITPQTVVSAPARGGERTAAPDGDAPAVPRDTPADIAAALAYDPKDPLANLEAADALDKMARGPRGDGKPPAGGCAVVDGGRRVWPGKGPAAIAAVGRGFVIAGYARREGREQLFVVHLPEQGLPQPITAFDIDPPHPRARVAAPGLAARDENEVAVAFVDGKGELFVRKLRVASAGGGAPTRIAGAVDTRFEPALAHGPERTLIAWTEGSTPMRAKLAVMSSQGAITSRHDLTPTSMGASAPSFVAGASPPVLVAIDARDGFSPVLRIDIGSDGAPAPATVALPLSMVATPPELAAASSSTGTYVAFAGLGAAATSAVGLVAIAPIAGTPLPLVRGTAYGRLHLAATSAPRSILVAADAPAAAPAAPGAGAENAPREVQVRVVGLQGPGPTAVLRGHGGAANAAIARDDAGNVGVAFSSDSGVYVAQLRCDDG